MHVAAKITLGLGGVITLLGVLFTVSGGYALDNLEDIDIEEVSVWNGEEGTYDFDNKDTLIYVRDNVRCDSFTFSMTDDSGEYPYENDECTKDGSKPAGYLDDPEGWYHVGSVNTTGEYVIEASSEVYLVTGSAIFGEILTEAGGSVLTALGGILLVCCGILFLILGGIFALFLGTEDTSVGLVAGPGGFTTSSIPTTSINTPDKPPTTPISDTESSYWETD